MSTAAGEVVLEARGLRKHYGPVVAAAGMDLEIRRGEVMALVGDNGAGKSTLVKMLSGAIRPDAGEIVHRGRAIQLHGPHDARERGIETTYQDLALAPNRDVIANLYLGREIVRGGLLKPLGILDRREMTRRATDQLSRLGVRLPALTGTPVGRMSGGQQQGVAVARAASWATDVLFMDEPTAALGVRQSEAVLQVARRIAQSGVGVVLITHIMPHVMEVADRVVVLRHGRKVADMTAAELRQDRLIALMAGYEEGEAA
ncbi:ATP-binding cassette domain-containing protein [Conexibacter arvalis]|uniref:Simple sugar transport system ATP-binding protein n=1 Tax=Conexibacter arvalis TaxID=912552 RepID=A0A840IJD7_9ACTN|nr:ATP-binding cassette domain-containing protein [Conexibacter arvalis]MBB4664849.1 simple sugar transport system ATP-binding protein [Conexibacter arvalis]